MSEDSQQNQIVNYHISRRELFWAGVLFLIFPLLYGAGQDVFAHNYIHDDYYFLKKSNDFDLEGHYLAYIRECLYPLFVSAARLFGLGLRNVEIICYALGLLWLWHEVSTISKSRWIAWGTVFPLLFFTYQHPVFNRVTYDALQLILTPYTLAASLSIITSGLRVRALLVAGLVAALQALTRPEGSSYVLIPLAAVVFTVLVANAKSPRSQKLKSILLCGGVLIAIPWIAMQCVSAYHYVYHGFWGTTIVRSAPFQKSLKALMSIDPSGEDYDPYGTLPIAAIRKGYEASPHLRATESFFANNLGGKGWSSYGYPGYLTQDGSVAGGNVQWVWLEAVSTVAGPQPKAMLEYHQQVADEIEEAFHNGTLDKRYVLSTALGPNVTLWRSNYYRSLLTIGLRMAHWGGVDEVLPVPAKEIGDSKTESDYNRFALRRKDLGRSEYWQRMGWIADKSRGLPLAVSLDTEAQAAGVTLELIRRPDVVHYIFPELETLPVGRDQVGFFLSVDNDEAGHILVQYENAGEPLAIPVKDVQAIHKGQDLYLDSTRIHVDNDYGSSGTAYEIDYWLMKCSTTLTIVMHYTIRYAFLLSIVALPVTVIRSLRSLRKDPALFALCAITWVSLVLVGVRWVTLAALDAWVTLAYEPRYIASGIFAVWLLTTATCAYITRRLYTTKCRARQCSE